MQTEDQISCHCSMVEISLGSIVLFQHRIVDSGFLSSSVLVPQGFLYKPLSAVFLRDDWAWCAAGTQCPHLKLTPFSSTAAAVGTDGHQFPCFPEPWTPTGSCGSSSLCN